MKKERLGNEMRKRIARILLITAIAISGLFQSVADGSLMAKADNGGDQPPASDLLASYPLIEDVRDVSGNGNHGEAIGNVTYADGLTLPGGTNSGTNYVKLPVGLFDHQDNLTISVWLKSNTGSGNYSALFFGTPANASKLPENYWLFNPTNPSGNFKSVFTNSINSGAPWNTEVGVTSASTTGYRGVWTHYTTVISPTAITGYINGVKIGTANKTKKVSDFGAELQAYIGRSNYLNDYTFAGSFQDLRIYGKALDDAGVVSVYADATNRMALQQAKKELSLGDISAVTENLTLPLTGINGTTITWESGDKSALTDTGIITLKEAEQTVILTATIALNGISTTKRFTVTLVSINHVMDAIANKLHLPYVITENDKLPASVGGAAIAWSSSDISVIGKDGDIHPPTEGMADVTLTATVSYAGQQAKKIFNIKIIESSPSYMLGYTRSGGSVVTDALHLGYSQDGAAYTALNNNTGVLFPKADFSDSIEGVTNKIIHPYIFRMQNGEFGVIATRLGNSGQTVAEKSSVLLFTSENLITYQEIGLISLHTNEAVNNAMAEYDASTGEYRIEWKAADGTGYYNTTKDFVNVSVPKKGSAFAADTPSTDIENAIPVNRIPVTKAEAKVIVNKLAKVTNTAVSDLEVTIAEGQKFTFADLSKMKVTAAYSDGSTADKAVNWNESEFNQIDFNREGVYRVSGKVKQTEYPSPMIRDYADPNVFLFRGKYYFIATNENGQKNLNIRTADTILALKDAPSVTIWSANSSGAMSGSIWAPELHEVGGNLYIFFAAGSPSWNTVQSHVMKLKEGGNPLSPSDWESPIKVRNKAGEDLYTQGITLDMTYFGHKEEHYLVWAQREITSPVNGSSDLYIAKINPEEPWKLTTDPVRIARPDYGWDRRTTPVDEGPFALKHGDKVFLTFSGSGVDQTYVIGLLTADEDSDLLNPASWTKSNYPILASESVPGEFGPGHNSYTMDEDGNLVNIYHTIPGTGGRRNMHARRVHWAADGSPVLDMTTDREILPENRTVTTTIMVENASPDKAYTISTTFNMDKLEANKLLHATVTARNNGSSITKAMVIVALYEGDRMINVSYLSKEILVGATEKLTAGFRLPGTLGSRHKVKVFVWDGESLETSNGIPLSEVVELTT